MTGRHRSKGHREATTSQGKSETSRSSKRQRTGFPECTSFTLVRCFLQPRRRLNTSPYHFIPPASHPTFSFHRRETDVRRGRELAQGHTAGKCWTRGCTPGGKPHARQRALSLKMSLTFKICVQKITFQILIFGIDFSSSQLCLGQEQGSAAPPICSEDRRGRRLRRLRPGSHALVSWPKGPNTGITARKETVVRIEGRTSQPGVSLSPLGLSNIWRHFWLCPHRQLGFGMLPALSG